MKCNINRARAKAERDDVAAMFVSCLDAVCGTALRKFGWGRGRLQRMYDTTQRSLSDVMVTCTAADTTAELNIDYDDQAALQDTAETALWYMSRELKGCGYDFFSEDSGIVWRDPYVNKWLSPVIKKTHAARLDWCRNVEFMAKVYILNVLVYARREGFGAERLSKLHAMIRSGYNEFVETWLCCYSDSDAACLKFVRDKLAALESLGLELIDLK